MGHGCLRIKSRNYFATSSLLILGEKRVDRKRNDFKTQVPVTTPPALLSLTPFLFFLAILTTYFNEFTTIYLSQSNT